MANNLSYIRRLIYNLKRRFGTPVDLYNNQISPGDVTTGKKNVTRQKYFVIRAIVTPAGFTVTQILSAAYMKNVGRDFAYGANLDRDILNVVIDAHDLPAVPVPEEWQLVTRNRRYNVTRVDTLEGNVAHSLICKAVKGPEIDQLLTLGLRQGIRFTQIVTAVVN